ncbi:hypothetical protein [Candidatus Frankia nodulisporulans]|uniref:hypothetical protein n=1 Tax=Candidatus Frankia nodulisporulans TaxID=2060052 RepID=UPI0013D5D52E|nr:hypothetical protein [Candidatus Frankia nodulisporulans]
MKPTEDTDLLDQLRALRTDAPRHRVSPTFGAAVHARARRHQGRARIAGVAALVALIAAGVTIPTALLTDRGHRGDLGTVGTWGSRATGWTYGSVTVGWLPQGSVHVLDSHGFPLPQTFHGAAIPTGPAGWVNNQPWTYISSFQRRGGGRASTFTVGIDWLPGADGYSLDQLRTGFPGAVSTTVAGQPALRVGDGTTPAPSAALGGETGPHYRGALYWQAGPHGPTLALLVEDTVPVDWTEVHALATGLRVGTWPGAVGDTDTAAIRTAVQAVFAPATADAQWEGLVQGGPALLATRRALLTDHPGFVATLDVTVSWPVALDATHATIEAELAFTEPRLRASPGHTSDSVTVTVVRTGSTWQVDAATICGAYTTIGLLDRCP